MSIIFRYCLFLGGLQAIAELLQLDHEFNGSTMEQYNITMRRYACMALTNLTFGDGTNKALLCSVKSAMRALVAQLHSSNEDLRQVAASVLRNLSWRADLASKKTLREVGSVTALTRAAMEVKKESTLKSILSALWNLSAHCSENKADICAVEGSLSFLVSTLTYKSPSKTLAIIENGGGILRNISSHIAVREDYRHVLRLHCCLQILLKHLRSPSLTIVSNACGTLWNLSARCPEDQKALWEMGAVNMLRNLVHSKHKMISMGSSAALKNLLTARPNLGHIEGDRLMPTNRPGLHVRKQRALEAEIDAQNLSETCENLESPQGSPTETRKVEQVNRQYMFPGENGAFVYPIMDVEDRRPMLHGLFGARGGSAENSPMVEPKFLGPHGSVPRSGSQDSVGSTHSDISHDRGRIHNILKRGQQDGRLVASYDRKLVTNAGDLSGEYRRGFPSDAMDLPLGSPNNRIMQVMQEVVLHAGINDSSPKAKDKASYVRESQQHGEKSGSAFNHIQTHSEESGKIPVYKGSTGIPVFRKQTNNTEALDLTSPGTKKDFKTSAEVQGGDVVNLNFPSHSGLENLHLDLPEPEQDEPINYSMKYSEPHAQSRRDKSQIIGPSQSSAFVKPHPKVQNFVAPGTPRYNNSNKPSKGQGNMQKSDTKSSTGSEGSTASGKGQMGGSRQFSSYGETEVDHDMDQPTNFSIRFVEQEEEVHTTEDQPINYSTRYQEEEHTSGNQGHRHRPVHPEYGEPEGNDDTTKTFCTEGTPLTYMSTATSLNDLSGKASQNLPQGNTRQPISQSGKQVDTGSGPVVEDSRASQYAASEKLSGTETQSTERNTGSTVIRKKLEKPQMSAGMAKSSPPRTQSSSHPPSMYSYNDSTSTSSPSDKPHQYCTEGTPMTFSRRSSLSSLHSSDAQESGSKAQDETLQCADGIDESLNDSQNNVTLKVQDESFQSGNTSANTSGPSKTVTFDDNNQVQETPLMFSRCSSLGSLSSFDAHSVHSSVVSDYSRRASEVVSPSELPDSPSDTMPPSPSHRKSPVKFLQEQPEKRNENNKPEKTEPNKAVEKPVPIKLDTIPENTEPTRSPEHALSGTSQSPHVSGTFPGNQVIWTPAATSAPVPEMPRNHIFHDAGKVYADEGSPPGENFSSATSLSALTIDDDAPITKDPGLRRVPLGQETEPSDLPVAKPPSPPKEMVKQYEPEKDYLSLDEDDNNSSVSEGEENLLAECISMAMPTYSAKKKIKKSSSDGLIKKPGSDTSASGAADKGARKFPGSRIPTSASAGALASKNSRLPMPTSSSSRFRNLLQNAHEEQDDYLGGQDSPRKFATEGTPLNFSRAESPIGEPFDLDMSDMDHTMQTVVEVMDTKGKQKEHDVSDDRSDVSSLADDDDNEDLLSEAIMSAMPTSGSRGKWKATDIDRRPEGSDTKDKFRFQSPRQRQPSQGHTAVPRVPSTGVPPPAKPPITAVHDANADSVMTFAVEDTPVNFSRTTSFSDLTVDSYDGVGDGASQSSSQDDQTRILDGNKNPKIRISKGQGGGASNQLEPCLPPLSVHDSPRVYGMEGTPVSFSRNDSLSSLSCDEDEDMDRMNFDVNQHMSPKNKPPLGSRKPGIQSPAIARLKTPSKSPRIGGHEPSCTSTPVIKGTAAMGQRPSPRPGEDQVRTFATEGTPACFSRNSSLSSLESEPHDSSKPEEHLEGHVPSKADQSSRYLVEDTPANLSGDASLSSLSVESLSFEPDEMESALLEECINAAMPQKKKKKQVLQPQNQEQEARGNSETSGAKRSSKMKLFSSSQDPGESAGAAAAGETRSNQKPKNGQGPQAEQTNELLSLSEQQQSTSTNNLPQEEQAFPEITDDTVSGEAEEEDKFEDQLQEEQTEGKEAEDLDEEEYYEDDSKVMEAIHQVESKLAALELEGSVQQALDKTLCLGAPKASVNVINKMHQNVLMESTGSKILESSTGSSELDIMKESFPELTSSLVSSIATPDRENQVTFPDAETTVLAAQDGEGGHGELVENNQNEESEDKEEKVEFFLDTEDGVSDFANADERALEENANLILSELSMNRAMSGSLLDDDMFIEHETLSLVSADCMSDTESEVSECASIASSTKTTSEQASEASTISHSSSAPAVASPKLVGRPRIVKPSEKPKPAEESKGIRGGKKKYGIHAVSSVPVIKSGTPPAVRSGLPQKTAKTPPTAQKGKPNPPLTRAASTPTTKKTPPKTTPPRSASTVTKPSPKAGGAAATNKSPATKPTASVSPKTNTTGFVRTGSGKGRGVSPASKTVSSPPSRPGTAASSGKTQPATKTSPTSAAASGAKAMARRGSSPARPTGPAKTASTSPGAKGSPKPVRNTRTTGPGKPATTPPKNSSTATKSPGKTEAKSAGSGIPRPGQKTSPRGEDTTKIPRPGSGNSPQDNLDRPKPPIKQGTFTMDSPTHSNAPEISPLASPAKVDSRAEKSTSLGIRKPPMGSSEGDSKKISQVARSKASAVTEHGDGSQEEKEAAGGWSKALETYSFLVDGAEENQSEPVKFREGRTSIPGRSNPSSRTSTPTRPASSSSLNKAGSRGSLAHTHGSSGSLNKGTNNNNSKVGPRTPPRSSSLAEGQSRLAKTSPRRSSTPPARPAAKTSEIPAPSVSSKKPAVSKIAGLWRKDKKAESIPQEKQKDGKKETKSSKDKERESKTQQKSPKGGRRGLGSMRLGKSKKSDKASDTDGESATDTIRRSSTYDKLTPETSEVANVVHGTSEDAQEPEATGRKEGAMPPPLPPRNNPLWRRTYTVSAEEISQQPADSDQENQIKPEKKDGKGKSKKHSLSLWRKHHDNDDKTKDSQQLSDGKTEQQLQPAKKKGFSLWRRDSESKTSSKESRKSKGSPLDGAVPPLEQPSPEPSRRKDKISVPVAAIKSLPNPSAGGGDSRTGLVSLSSPLGSPTRTHTATNAAIVAPFNYNPKPKASSTQQPAMEVPQPDPTLPSPTKHFTKTEMLIERRRRSYLSSLSSLKNEDCDQQQQDSGKKPSPLVTTV